MCTAPPDEPSPLGGRRVIRHAIVDSTNERALESVQDGSARHGDWHVAEAQERGRGRRGAAWRSPAGEGLYATLILLPPASSAVPPPALTMAAGLGILDAVRALGLDRAHLKWPNDLVVGPSKLAGVLVEARGLDPGRPHFVVGIGLNVLQRAFPAALLAERPVTSLALEGLGADLAAAFGAVAPRVEHHLERSFDPRARRALTKDFAVATGLLDSTVRVWVGERSVEGRLLEVDLEHGIQLETRGPAGTAGAWTEPQALALEHVTRLEAADASPEAPDGGTSPR